ncbi:hypothetical protein [Cellvibrio japonicus]|uniref:Transcriptional regulator SutA RNAP-binding domain-containing protein n=1 Tax=Cellvibrio japonicus (strain Ueda107) TaxID=498211 RepID=B3PC24_CELJU|nr:hypothetical protein [Cellvibrio japonicus]ACE83142.1 hypothetical protein CJA_2838 [Cellvibrio japonicus Ueda107]QEI13176.1 hypothetical protein FY117_13710 [Cellvibrio japonicus]QEI16750.1 hypothetical protein FY116_13715 [Cellvibrio japonicus]QEI20328.1 hypothetical protein FY115_13710 [Cellvibrio japonicus]
MKPTKTRRELHNELEEQVREYLRTGGKVNEVPRGLSGRPYAQSPLISIFEGTSHEDRTPVPEVVAAIEARKKPQAPARQRKPRPHKRVILDDFGQPLRWEWVED